MLPPSQPDIYVKAAGSREFDLPALFAFLHHIAAFTLFTALVVELVLIRNELTVGRARRIQVADVVFGLSAGILLVVGFLRVSYFEKGAYCYFHNWTFMAKLTLFVIVALLSIVPTIEFLSWRKDVRQGQAPNVATARRAPASRMTHFRCHDASTHDCSWLAVPRGQRTTGSVSAAGC